MTRKIVAASRIGPALASAANAVATSSAISWRVVVGLFHFDEPRGRPHRQCLPRPCLGAAADDGWVRALDLDIGEPDRHKHPTNADTLSGGVQHWHGNIDRDDAAMLANRIREGHGDRAGAAANFKYGLAARKAPASQQQREALLVATLSESWAGNPARPSRRCVEFPVTAGRAAMRSGPVIINGARRQPIARAPGYPCGLINSLDLYK